MEARLLLLLQGMPRDDFENAELHDEIAHWRRGEMAVVADLDACDDLSDDEMPDTVPETRPLGARNGPANDCDR